MSVDAPLTVQPHTNRSRIIYVDVESQEIQSEIQGYLDEILAFENDDVIIQKHTDLDPHAPTIQHAMGDAYDEGKVEELVEGLIYRIYPEDDSQ